MSPLQRVGTPGGKLVGTPDVEICARRVEVPPAIPPTPPVFKRSPIQSPTVGAKLDAGRGVHMLSISGEPLRSRCGPAARFGVDSALHAITAHAETQRELQPMRARLPHD